jgi:hypothetical protein
MNLQNWISKYFYLLLTIIIIGIIIYVWNTNIYEGAISNISPVSSNRSPSSNSYSSTPSSDDPRIKIDTSLDVNKNKLYADQLYTTTLDQSIQNIDDDIKAVQNMINDIKKDNVCDICNKSFITYSGLYKHKKKCQVIENKNELTNEFRELDNNKQEITIDLVLDLIKQNKVIVFSKTTCPYCDKTKELFKSLKSLV